MEQSYGKMTRYDAIPEALASVLKKNRSLLNNLFEIEYAKGYGLDPDSFLASFKGVILPLYSITEPGEETVISIYRTVCALCARDLLGVKSRYPRLEPNLLTLLDPFRELLAENGGALIDAIVSGMLSVMRHTGSDASGWVRLLSAIPANGLAYDTFLSSGIIAAWLSGLAEYRDEALSECGKLLPPVFSGLFGLELSDARARDGVIESLRKDPWLDPRGNRAEPPDRGSSPVFRLAGGFSGFGGRFERPPSLVTDAEGILATDGKKHFRLFADFFGASLVREPGPAGRKNKHKGEPDFSITENAIAFKGNRYEIPPGFRIRVRDAVSFGNTCAFTSALSHRIFVSGFKDASHG